MSDELLAANTWNTAVDSIARLVDGHYAGSQTSAAHMKVAKGGGYSYDTDIGNLVRSLRQPAPPLPGESNARIIAGPSGEKVK